MIQVQHLRRNAQAIAAALPPDGWQTAWDGGRVVMRHPAHPGLELVAKANNPGSHLLGTTFTVWLRTPQGVADVLAESVLGGRDLAAAALADVRWTYGAEGSAANALVRLLGAAWAGGVRSAWMRIALHRASTPDGEMVLSAGRSERRRRLPGGIAGPLARVTDDDGRVCYALRLATLAPETLSAHARMRLADEARALAQTCGLDAQTSEDVARRVLRDLAGAAVRRAPCP